MLRRLVRRTVLLLVTIVAFAWLARAIVSRVRPSPSPAVAWPPIKPVGEPASTSAPGADALASPEGQPSKAASTRAAAAKGASAKAAPANREPLKAATTEAKPDRSTSWVLPEGGACPTSHPIKAKLSSGIFHSPGGLNYDRTHPDRCYTDADAAETDGLRPSKR